MAKPGLNQSELPKIDEEFEGEELTQGKARDHSPNTSKSTRIPRPIWIARVFAQRIPSPSVSLRQYISCPATNLPDPEAAHQQRFEMQIHGPNSFSRGETYLEKGKADSSKVTYSRRR